MRQTFWLAFIFAGPSILIAQPVPPAATLLATLGGQTNPASPGTNRVWGAAYGTNAVGVTNTSPVAYFRELLAMTPAQRDGALAEKSDEQRRYYAGKLAEYQSLSQNERELRFRTTELRWYLLPLMRMDAASRADCLAAVPPDYRNLVDARLKQWDQISPDLQKDVLERELTMSYYLRLEGSTRAQQENILARMSRERREQLEKDLASFRAISPDRRQKMLGQFNQFFDLDEKEKSRILSELTNNERAQLKELDKLSPDQRIECIKAYYKFAGMSPDQQAIFMKNAELWQKMSPAQRQLWRNLNQDTPPMPPGLGEPPLPPESPFDRVARDTKTLLSTNGH